MTCLLSIFVWVCSSIIPCIFTAHSSGVWPESLVTFKRISLFISKVCTIRFKTLIHTKNTPQPFATFHGKLQSEARNHRQHESCEHLGKHLAREGTRRPRNNSIIHNWWCKKPRHFFATPPRRGASRQSCYWRWTRCHRFRSLFCEVSRRVRRFFPNHYELRQYEVVCHHLRRG